MTTAPDLSYTFAMQLNITNLCNLRCPHCYHENHQPHGKLQIDDYCTIITKYLDVCAKWTVRPHLIICGGEPLISRDLDAVCAWYARHSNNEDISVLTNGTLATDERLRTLARYNVSRVQISLDGACAETHDLIRGRGNFARTMDGIAAFQRHGFFVSVNTVLSRRNLREVRDFFVHAQSQGITRLTFQRFVPIGIGANVAEDMLSPDELRHAYQTIHAAATEYKISTNYHDGLFTLIDPQLGSPSPIGYTAFVVMDDGSILFSSRLPLVLGNALTDDLETIWLQHPFLIALRDRSQHECTKCPHFGSCGGNEEINFAYWGEFHRTDPQCWLRFDQLPRIERDPTCLQPQTLTPAEQSFERFLWNKGHAAQGH